MFIPSKLQSIYSNRWRWLYVCPTTYHFINLAVSSKRKKNKKIKNKTKWIKQTSIVRNVNTVKEPDLGYQWGTLFLFDSVMYCTYNSEHFSLSSGLGLLFSKKKSGLGLFIKKKKPNTVVSSSIFRGVMFTTQLSSQLFFITCLHNKLWVVEL